MPRIRAAVSVEVGDPWVDITDNARAVRVTHGAQARSTPGRPAAQPSTGLLMTVGETTPSAAVRERIRLRITTDTIWGVETRTLWEGVRASPRREANPPHPLSWQLTDQRALDAARVVDVASPETRDLASLLGDEGFWDLYGLPRLHHAGIDTSIDIAPFRYRGRAAGLWSDLALVAGGVPVVESDGTLRIMGFTPTRSQAGHDYRDTPPLINSFNWTFAEDQIRNVTGRRDPAGDGMRGGETFAPHTWAYDPDDTIDDDTYTIIGDDEDRDLDVYSLTAAVELPEGADISNAIGVARMTVEYLGADGLTVETAAAADLVATVTTSETPPAITAEWQIPELDEGLFPSAEGFAVPPADIDEVWVDVASTTAATPGLIARITLLPRIDWTIEDANDARYAALNADSVNTWGWRDVLLPPWFASEPDLQHRIDALAEPRDRYYFVWPLWQDTDSIGTDGPVRDAEAAVGQYLRIEFSYDPAEPDINTTMLVLSRTIQWSQNSVPKVTIEGVQCPGLGSSYGAVRIKLADRGLNRGDHELYLL